MIDLIGRFISQSLAGPIAVLLHKVLAQAQKPLAHGGITCIQKCKCYTIMVEFVVVAEGLAAMG
jgi:hypothetical protein